MRFIKTKAIYYILSLVLLSSTLPTGYSKQSSDLNKGDSSDSSGPIMSPKQISGKNGKGQQVSPQEAKTTEMAKICNIRKYPLASPTNFLKDGVYIWCDPDGLWTIFLKENKDVIFSAKLQSNSPLEIKKKSNNLSWSTTPDDPNIIVINSKIDLKKAVVQFSSTSPDISFDILINNQNDPNCIYIGHLIDVPSKNKFSLPNRRNLKTTMGEVSSKTPVQEAISLEGQNASMAASSKGGGNGGKSDEK